MNARALFADVDSRSRPLASIRGFTGTVALPERHTADSEPPPATGVLGTKSRFFDIAKAARSYMLPSAQVNSWCRAGKAKLARSDCELESTLERQRQRFTLWARSDHFLIRRNVV